MYVRHTYHSVWNIVMPQQIIDTIVLLVVIELH